MTEPRYLLRNSQVEAGARFDALAELFDGSTLRHMDDLGLAEGWRVWEVGAGGASIPRMLGALVGETGRVLATDIDTSWTEPAASDVVEVRRHDLVNDLPPDELFDLVHARLLLVHLAEREEALRTMVQVLRPGGWLLIEDADPALQPLVCIDEYGPEQALANKLKAAFRVLLSERGADPAFGRRLPRLLRGTGLENVAADAYFPVTAPATAFLEVATVNQIREQLVARGLASEAEIAEHLANVQSGNLDLTISPMISCWGQKPG